MPSLTILLFILPLLSSAHSSFCGSKCPSYSTSIQEIGLGPQKICFQEETFLIARISDTYCQLYYQPSAECQLIYTNDQQLFIQADVPCRATLDPKYTFLEYCDKDVFLASENSIIRPSEAKENDFSSFETLIFLGNRSDRATIAKFEHQLPIYSKYDYLIFIGAVIGALALLVLGNYLRIKCFGKPREIDDAVEDIEAQASKKQTQIGGLYRLLGISVAKPVRNYLSSKEVETLEAMQIKVESADRDNVQKFEQDTCYICLEEMKVQDGNVGNFLCNRHFAHIECLKKWVKSCNDEQKGDLCPLKCTSIIVEKQTEGDTDNTRSE